MIEKPSVGRAIIKQTFNGLVIEIPSKKNWFVILFLLAWMGGWVMGELFAINSLFDAGSPINVNLFLLFWVVGWTIGGAFAIYVMLWQLFGKEIINLDKGVLSIENSIKGIGRKKQFDVKAIKSIDLSMESDMMHEGNYNYSLRGFSGGRIKFDYGMKTIKFAKGIDEAEAKMIIEKLKSNSNFRYKNLT